MAPPTKNDQKPEPGPVMDDRMTELLQGIQELDDTELQELRDLIMAAFDAAQSDPTEVHGEASLEALESLAAAATDVKREQERRTALGSRRDRAMDSLRAAVPEDRRPPRWRTSSRRGGATTRAITASGNELPDGDALTREFCDVLHRLSGTDILRDGDRRRVATLHADRPEERTLRCRDSAEAVTAAFDAATDEHLTAITAAGGLGAPEESDYALPGFETADRPVKAGLPSFTTERGGIRFVKPPTLAAVNDAIGIWDVPTDVAAATNPAIRKPALRVTPANEVVVDVQAITNTLVFGNMLSRAYPEYVQRCIGLSMGTHARVAEQQLLTQIGALSTQVTGATGETAGLGATRVLLPLLDRAATGMRHRLRTDPNAPLTLIVPHWARGVLRSDLARQEPGDATLGVSDADLASYLTQRGITPVWALDGEAGQNFDVQNPGPVNAWPAEIVSYLYPSGAFQHLDGGTLDLGLVRDSTLIAANDYIMFTETFETVAYRGGEALRIKMGITPSGIARAAAVVA